MLVSNLSKPPPNEPLSPRRETLRETLEGNLEKNYVASCLPNEMVQVNVAINACRRITRWMLPLSFLPCVHVCLTFKRGA